MKHLVVIFTVLSFWAGLAFSQETIDLSLKTEDGHKALWRVTVPTELKSAMKDAEKRKEWIETEFEKAFGRAPSEISNMDELIRVVGGIHRYSDWFSRIMFGLGRAGMGGGSGGYVAWISGATHQEAMLVGWIYGFVSFALGFFNQEIQDFVLTGGEFHRLIQRKFGLQADSIGLKFLRRFEELFRSFALEKIVVASQAGILLYATQERSVGSETLIALAAALGQTLYEISNAVIKKRKISMGQNPVRVQWLSNAGVCLVSMLTVISQFGALRGLAAADVGLALVMAWGAISYSKLLIPLRAAQGAKSHEKRVKSDVRRLGMSRCALFAI